LAQRFGVTSIGLFGSYARAEVREGSDIDIAIELRPGHKSLRNFFGLRRYLEQELERPVDLGIESALKPQVRDEIAKEIFHI
jgi:predicted nucleotidyltransferase